MKTKLDVFLSSDSKEFKRERKELPKMIRKIPFLDCTPLEFRGASDEDVRSASLKAARECDIYIGIFGNQYSKLTIEEYYEAVKHRKRCLSYVKSSKHRNDKLGEFIKEELKNRFKYHEFKRNKELHHQIKRDLDQLLFDTLKRGLEIIEKEKATAQNVEKLVIREAAKLAAEPTVKDRPRIMFGLAQRAYTQGRYLESIATSAIAIELSLRNALLNIGRKKEELEKRPIGWLIYFAAINKLIDKRELHSLRELQHIRNMTIHEGTIPPKQTAAWALQITKRILDSLSSRVKF